jgi:uncharacterized protein YdeI (YjbR/CyaY-like superfamily)
MADHPSVTATSRAAWRAWLQKHHAASTGVWVMIAKKHATQATVRYDEAVEEALCFGWIDARAQPVNDTFYRQLFTPRRARSAWAASNKRRVETLIAAGRMTDAGMKAIAVAKDNGAWDALTAAETLTVPDDLANALKRAAGAKKAFDAYTPGVRKQCLFHVTSAKRPETRAKRIASIVATAAAGRKPFSS